MKKPYSLDYEIIRDTDRNALVTSILDSLDITPSDSELEQMADYILFGKDEKYMSARDRREISQPKRRYNSWATKDEKNESLDALMEDPNIAPQIEARQQDAGPRYKVFKPEIKRPTYDKDGNLLDPGDSDIPGMVELWAEIDRLQEKLDMYRGKIPANEQVKAHPMSNYQLYKFGHMLIDIRRIQYYLKDSYKPPIRCLNPIMPGKVEIDFSSNTGLWLTPEEWCARKRNPKPFDLPQPNFQDAPQNAEGKLYWKISDNAIDYENPDHILELLNHYVNLLKHNYDHPESNVMTLLYDLEDLVGKSDLTDVEQFILEQRVAHRNVFIIQKALQEEGYPMTDLQIRTLSRTKIPRKIAATATRIRLENEAANGLIETLECSKCRKKLPKHPFYFARSRDKRSGFCSQCKACQKAFRDRKKEVNT